MEKRSPKMTRAIAKAFNLAWSELGPKVGTKAALIEDTRMRLAQAILSVVSEETTDPVALKNAALSVMARSHDFGV